MNKCCFCFDLKSGTIASGVFVLITRTLVIILFSTVLALRQKHPYDSYHVNYEDLSYNYVQERELPWYHQIEFSNTRIMVSIGISCLHLLFSIILLIGVKEKKKSLFLPWIVLIGMEIFVGIGFVIMTFIMTGLIHSFPKITSTIIGIAFQCYIQSCVIYYYRQLAARENNTIYNIIPMNSPNIPTTLTNTTDVCSYNTPHACHISDQPPKYDHLSTSIREKPPPYDEIKRNDECKGY